MYCENCGHKIGDNHLFCEECGKKLNRILTNEIENKNTSNKTLWIVFGCIFGGVFLIFIVGFILSTFLIVSNVKTSEEYDEYKNYDYVDIKNPYPYRDDNIKVERFNKI